jgi:dolichol-phosphate mannosyltransferase
MQSEHSLHSNGPLGSSLHEQASPLLTVIVPVFNERATIEKLLGRVIAAPYHKQVIVVDDGSTDGTSEILGRWAETGAIELRRHDCNRGKGRAIRTALESARGRFVIVQDGDLETDPQDYLALVEPLLEGRAEFVIGSRFAPGSRVDGRAKLSLRLGVSLLNVAVLLLYRLRITDEACCYKVASTESLKAMDLQCERFEFCPEVVAKARRMNLRIVEVPISYRPRTTADGKKLRYRDGLSALWWLWKTRKWNPGVEQPLRPDGENGRRVSPSRRRRPPAG